MYHEIQLANIQIRKNHRKKFSESGLTELAESIASVGIIQPITVRPIENDIYELVAGERRYRASGMANKPTITCIVRDLTDEEVLIIQVTENIQRENLNPIEEAESIADFLALGKNPKEIALIINKSEKFVHQRNALNKLIEEGKELVYTDILPLQYAYKIAALDEKKQADCLKQIVVRDDQKNPLAVRNIMELNFWIKSNSIIDLTIAPFDLTLSNLVPGCVSCMKCPKRTCTNGALFEEYSKDNKCLDPICYDSKVKAHTNNIIQELQRQGKEPLLISDAMYGQPKGTINPLQFEIKEKSDKCKKCQLAVVIHSDKNNEGKQVYVCMPENCPHAKQEQHHEPPTPQHSSASQEEQIHSKLVIELVRNELIVNHKFDNIKVSNLIKCWCMFFNLDNQYRQQVVNKLGWTIEDEDTITEVSQSNCEMMFFENFKGSVAEVQEVERMYVMEMFIAVDEQGKSGYELQDNFVNEHITSVTVSNEKKFTKVADKLIKLRTAPEKRYVKNITADQLLMAFKTDSDLLMLADKLGLTIDLKSTNTISQIAKIIIEKHG